jgi:NTE family protein
VRLQSSKPAREPVVGLALGGGFARGIAHLGVLRVLEEHQIPISMISGVSAGAIVAAAYASGASVEEIARVALAMRFKDVARWTVSRLGLAASERMSSFLRRLLKTYQFEQMRVPLAVVATDLSSGVPVVFEGHGDVILPVRASCSYPGLFQPVRYREQCLVDGAMSMEVPSPALRSMGATHVISVSLAVNAAGLDPRNMFQVVNRCFQILHTRTETEWRRDSDVVLEPDCCDLAWDSFPSAEKLIQIGEDSARAALPQIKSWLREPSPSAQTPRLQPRTDEA